MVVGSANAALTEYLKDTIRGDDLYLFSSAEIEDGTMRWYYQDGYTPGDPMANAKGVPRDNNTSSSYSNVPGPEYGQYGETYTAVPDLFSLLPEATITAPEDIVKVEMVLYQGSPVGGEILNIYRITNTWLYPGSTGEDTVNAVHRLPAGESRYWAADVGKTPGTDTEGNPTYDNFLGFGPGDYTTAGMQSITLISSGSHPDPDRKYVVDITEIARAWYTEGNQGLVMVMVNDTWPHNDAPYLRDSDKSTSWDSKTNGGERCTEFIVTYAPEPMTISLLAIGGIAFLRRRRR
jgi:hypothetical protein